MQNSSIKPIFSNLTFEQVVLDTSIKLRDAEANKHIYEAFVYFKWMMDHLSNHIPIEERQHLEEDYIRYLEVKKEIESDINLNEVTKIKELDKLKEIFMDTHTRYVMLAWPRAGINRVEEEGLIDFDDVDYVTTRKIIRHKPIQEALDEGGKTNIKADKEISKKAIEEDVNESDGL